MNVDLEFEKAMTRACLRAVSRAARYEPMRGGDQTAVQYGPLIGEIADEADLSVPQTRRRLQALQAEGKVIRDDRRGGSTAWWLVGLAETQSPTSIAPPPYPSTAPILEHDRVVHDAVRQAFKAPGAAPRQHWSDVLGVTRDCSTSEARAAFATAVAALDEADPEYHNQLRVVRAAIDACCREHEIQVTE